MRKPSASASLLAFVLFLTTSGIQADQLDTLAGRYAFNWRADPAKTKCAAIDQKILKTFRTPAYSCDLKEKNNSSTGKAHVVCSGTSAEFLIFKTKAQCEDERKTQASNE